jgi:uncharacterized membrane protein YbaN (DUF454 family)
MSDTNPLWQDIIEFSRNKIKLAIGFIILGILGLILPIIPGFLLLAVGLFLLKPEWYEYFRKWFEKSK